MTLRALVFAGLIAFAGTAQAQTVAPAIEPEIASDVAVPKEGAEVVISPEVAALNLPKWDAFAALAEAIIAPGTATRFALTRLRSEILPWRETFSGAGDVNAARLATLDRQIATLTPAEGVEQTDVVITDRLAELDAVRGQLAQPRLLALEAFARADGLIDEIDAQLRSLERARLLQRSASPANPQYWPDAAVALAGGVGSAAGEVVATTKVFEADGRLWSRLATVTIGIIVATIFVFYARTMLSKLGARDLGSTPRLRAIIRFVISVARVILPVVGLSILVQILMQSGFFGLTGETVVAVLPAAGALVFYAKWLTDQYFPKGEHATGMLGYDHATRLRGRKYAVALGWTLAVSVLVIALSSATRASAVSLDVINLPFQLLVGYLLWHLGSQVVHKSEPGSEAIFKRGRVRKVIGRIAQAFAVAGPFASLLGFGAAAQAITVPAVVSLAIVATIAVLQRLSFEVMSRPAAVVVPSDDDQMLEVSDHSGLWPVIVNVGVVTASLPIFALVWGMTPADLSEVWSRFLSGFSVGGTQISPTSFLTFVLVFSLGYVITGFIKSSLKTSVLPRTRLDLGGQNAIVAGTGYFGIFIAALVGFSVAGIDLSSLAIVAGALSVGIGFGLQNIVSNFVSGIILLIERPVSEGEMIEVGGQMGYVRAISVRSTRIETFDKIDVIIPNADLVSGRVSNWTRGNLVGRAIVAVGVAYGSDTAKVAAILQEIAEANPIVVLNPPPSILLIRFGADSIDFEIRAIIHDVNYVNVAKSEMFHEIVRRFAEEGIEIPFAQRDVWLRNPEVLIAKGKAE